MKKSSKKLLLASMVAAMTLGMSITSFAGWQYNKQGSWYETSQNNYYTDCWKSIGGKWYHFGQDGYTNTNWFLDGDKWYYLGSDGAMRTGWQLINGFWYYMNSDGVMQTGWQKVGDTWYYLNQDGSMRTGWNYVNGHWFYLNGDGAMVTGWQKINNEWYYMNSDGVMLTGQQKIGDSYYLFDGSGKWVDSASSNKLLTPSDEIEHTTVMEANMTVPKIKGLTEYYYNKYYNDINYAFSMINDIRSANVRFDYSENLCKAATAHAIDMVSYSYFGHDNKNSKDVVEWQNWARLYDANIDGEVLAHDNTISLCVESLKNNSIALKNLKETAYTTAGVGFAPKANGELVFVVMLQK